MTTPRNVAATILGHAVSGLGRLAITSGSIWVFGSEIAGRVAAEFALGATVGTFAAVGAAGTLLHFEARERGSCDLNGATFLAPYLWMRVVWTALLAAAVVMAVLSIAEQTGWPTAPLLALGYAFYLFGKHVPFARRRIRGYVRTELLAFLGVCTALALGKAAHSGSVTLVALAASYMLAGVVGGWVGIGARVGGSPELQLRREMRSYAMWVVLATAVAFAAANLPVTVLAFRGGSAALADGARLAALTALLAPAYLLPRAVGMNLLVDISEQFGSAEGAPRALLAKVLMALVAMSLFGVLLVAVCGDSIAAFVTRSYEPEIGIAFRRLVLGTIVLLVTTPISNLLSGTGRVHLTALASVSQAVVTLGGVMLVEPSLGPFAGWILVGSLVKAVVTTVAASRVAAAPAWHAALALVSVTCVGAWLLIDAADGAAVAAVLAAFGCSVAAWRLLRWHRASSTAGGGSG